jgi:hypothetical protein
VCGMVRGKWGVFIGEAGKKYLHKTSVLSVCDAKEYQKTNGIFFCLFPTLLLDTTPSGLWSMVSKRYTTPFVSNCHVGGRASFEAILKWR